MTDMNHDRALGRLIASYIEPAVIEVREELAKKYNVIKGPERNYCGLCDEAVNMLADKIDEIIGELGWPVKNTYLISLETIHGEQQHHPRTRHNYWALQHTWCRLAIWINNNKYVIYVDPTSSQFKCIYHDIPDFYIARKPPKWYLPDRKNFRFSKIGRWLDRCIYIKVKVTDYSTPNRPITRWHRDGLIEFFQYEIWGKISDIIFWAFTYSTYFKY